MTAPKRIQRRRAPGWVMPQGAVYVGRPSRWGNPFRIYRGHSVVGPEWSRARETWTHIPSDYCWHAYVTSSQPLSRAHAVEQFRTLMNVRRTYDLVRLREWLAPLVGHDLACWCPLSVPCHADVLLDIANGDSRG